MELTTKQLFLSTAVVLLTATTAFAAPETFQCEFDSERAGNWVSEEIFLKIDEAAGTAFVADGMTWQKHEGWHDAKLTRASAKRFNMSWVVKGERDSARQIIHTLRYTLSFDCRNGKGFAEMKPQGYSNKFRTTGVCQPAKMPKALG